ncbi:unnamed protein product [Rhizophagus irregularis]|uniref:Uncharacterized protein n=1 Tax=Rhizophagus irregularis TaxID=588596 RepID=A0A2I1HMM1_9GLOM|nr:hypothetical protein RhiirA4_483494 [Rhizophagus irregularis]CAB4403802.1 unnamed protein product [Rhizophagus irregularis]
MFFTDSIHNYRSTEPIWFRWLRALFATIFLIIILIYSIEQFKQLVNVDESTIIVKSKSLNELSPFEISIDMFTGFPSVITNSSDVTAGDDPFIKRISLQFNNSNFLFFDVNTSFASPTSNSNFNLSNNSLLLRFSYFKFDLNQSETKLFFNSFDDLASYRGYDYYVLNDNFLLNLALGRSFLIAFDPIIVRREIYQLELNSRLEEQLTTSLESNKIRFEVRFRHLTMRYEERKETFADFISDLGGFYSAVVGTFILFFGMEKHQPWGVMQRYILSCVPCRKSLSRNFARKYVSVAGIPLAENANQRPENSSIDERVQILETLLKDYYIDDYYLGKVKNIKKLLEEYEEEQNKNV